MSPKKSEPGNRPAEVKPSDRGATAEDVANDVYGWTKGEPPPEPAPYDHAYAERATVDGIDYYRIVKTTGGSFVYDSRW